MSSVFSAGDMRDASWIKWLQRKGGERESWDGAECEKEVLEKVDAENANDKAEGRGGR